MLVPGSPQTLLVCRYDAAGSTSRPPARAGALRVRDPAVIARLARELDSLPPLPPRASCPVFGGRSELFAFGYRGARRARVRLVMEGCVPVTNGRVTREGLDLPMRAGEAHWPDEALL